MLDNNQIGKSIGQSNDIYKAQWAILGTAVNKGYYNGVDEGITRYDPSPDSFTKYYKSVGESGDHLLGHSGAQGPYVYASAGGNLQQRTHNLQCSSPDSSVAPNPKYRMRMALAMFLKDGTYELTNGGTIIPYIYDTSREIGGTTTTTVASVWNGLDGMGTHDLTAAGIDKLTSAQIFPCYDFVQGPLTCGAVANNYDWDVLFGTHGVWWKYQQQIDGLADTSQQGGSPTRFWSGRCWQIPPNPIPTPIAIVRRNRAREFDIWLKFDQIAASANYPSFVAGMPIFIYDLGGALGNGQSDSNDAFMGIFENMQQNPFDPDEPFNDGSGVGTTPDNHVGARTIDQNHNGWWLVNEVVAGPFVYDDILGDGDTSTFQGVQLRIQINTAEAGFFNDLGEQAAYKPNKGYVCQGRLGGNGESGIYAIPLENMSGFMAGMSQPETITGAAAGNDATQPSRPTIGYRHQIDRSNPNAVYDLPTRFAPRSISLRRADDNLFSLAPTVVATGGAVLRIPPSIGADVGVAYRSLGTQSMYVPTVGVNGTVLGKKDHTDLLGQKVDWGSKGLFTPLWSKMCSLTGRHGYDHVKPRTQALANWTIGRNRPFPIHERVGTKLGYSPSLLAEESNYGWSAFSLVGDRVLPNQETTKVSATEIGASPIWLDFEMSAFCPIRPNRLVKIQFDTGFEHPHFGRHGMLFQTWGPYPYHKTTVYASNNMVFTGINDPSGRSAGFQKNKTNGAGFYPTYLSEFNGTTDD